MVALQAIWDSLSQDSIERAIMNFRKRLQACVKADGGHFEHVLSSSAKFINKRGPFQVYK